MRDALEAGRDKLAAATAREGAGARLRLGADRRRRLRPDRHARAPGDDRRARRDRRRVCEAPRRDRGRGAGARRRRHAADAARRRTASRRTETAAFVERLRAARRRAGRDLRRALHLGARRAATTPARPRTCSRATWSDGSRAARDAPRRRGPSPEQVRRRRLVALASSCSRVVAVVAVVVAAAARARRSAARRRRCRRRRSRSGSSSPRASRAPQMAAARRRPSRRSRGASSGKRVALVERAVPRGRRRQLTVPCFAPHRRTKVEGFLFPATYDFLAKTTSKQLVQRAGRGVLPRTGQQVNLTYARSKNLTPYDVLTIASLIQGEAVVESERPLIAAVIYNRLHLAHVARDRRGAPLRAAHPRHEVDPRVAAPEPDAVQPAAARGPAADADRQPGPRVDPGGGAPGEGRLPLLRRASRTSATTSSRRARPRSSSTSARTATGAESSRSSGTRSRIRSRRGCRTPRSRRAGLDWRYEAFDVEDVLAAVAALRTLGFAGANVTIPHKQARRRRVRRGGGRRRQHARLPRRPRARLQHRQGDPRGHRRDARLRDRRRRRGGSARAGAARGHARLHAERGVAARRDRLRPDRERDARARRAARRAGAGQTVVDLAYGPEETALVAAARAAGCAVVDGREALVRQGAASFRLWTGLEPPRRRDARRRQDLAHTQRRRDEAAASASATAAIPPAASDRRRPAPATTAGRAARGAVDVRRRAACPPGRGCRGTTRTAAPAPRSGSRATAAASRARPSRPSARRRPRCRSGRP